MRGRTGLALLIVSGMVGWVGAAAADRASDAVLAKPAFTATPAELLAAAKAAPDGDEHARISMLRRERDTSFDAQGRATVREHEIYVVRAAAGSDDGDGDDDGDDKSVWVPVGWRPSIQDRPTIRLRVIDAGGAVHELEPGKIEDRDAAARARSPTRPWSPARCHARRRDPWWRARRWSAIASCRSAVPASGRRCTPSSARR